MKYKYVGSYPANCLPVLKRNSFAIINTETSDYDGEHWILLANKNGKIFFGDSMGQRLEKYPHIKNDYKQVTQLVKKRMQNRALCGLYCIYFAWSIFSGQKLPENFNDFDLLRYIIKYL